MINGTTPKMYSNIMEITLNQTLEDVILDLGKDYMRPDVIFKILMDEEYSFWDYCEGKQGDCLQPETKFFDGYWMPDININETLSDRLGELAYANDARAIK